MLTFEEKQQIIESFPELKRKDVSLGRINYQYEASAYDKKNVVYHLHRNGNGYVFAGLLQGYATDEKGFINIREFGEAELRALLRASIGSMTERPVSEQAIIGAEVRREERWTGPDGQTLLLIQEDELWYVYAGLNLESAFETYEEAAAYLQEEGFSPSPS